MTTEWKQIDVSLARQHPLYGVRGWLLLYLGSTVLGVFIFQALFSTLVKLDMPSLSFLRPVQYLWIGSLVVVLCLGFGKQRAFRATSIGVLWAQTLALTAISIKFEGGNGLLSSIGTIAGTAVWSAYLQKSRRVRVTYEHAVRVDDALLASGHARDTTPVQNPTAALVTPIPHHIPAVPQTAVPKVATQEPTEAAWAQAMAEYDGPERRGGVYAKYYAQTKGDEAAIKALYMLQRAAEINFSSSQNPTASTESTPEQLATQLHNEVLSSESSPGNLVLDTGISDEDEKLKEQCGQSSNRDRRGSVMISCMSWIPVIALIMGLAYVTFRPSAKPTKDWDAPATTGSLVRPVPPPTVSDSIKALYGLEPLNDVLLLNSNTSIRGWFSQAITHQGREYIVHFIQERHFNGGGQDDDARLTEVRVGVVTYLKSNEGWIGVDKQINLMTRSNAILSMKINMAEVISLSNGNMMMKIPLKVNFAGYNIKFVDLLGFTGRTWRSLGTVLSSQDNLDACDLSGELRSESAVPCMEFSNRIALDERSNESWPPINLIASGTVLSKDMKRIEQAVDSRYIFDGATYQVSPAKESKAASLGVGS